MFRRLMLCVVILVIGLLVVSIPPSAHAQGGATITQGQVDTAIQAIEKLAQQQIDTNATPGLAIAVVFDDKVVYTKGFGVREVGKPDLVTEDTVFQIASMSKSVASTVVATLVTNGVVTWDTPISQIDPSFQLHDPYPTQQVTIRDLMSHRSGLEGGVGNDLDALGYDRDTLLSRLHLVKPGSSFRSTYAYSNSGYTEGAVAAARPTGKTWEQVSEDNLYKPLGMNSTSSSYADFLTRTNHASLHAKIDGKWVAAVKFNDDAQSPAGGVSSSAKDLAQWIRLLLADGKYDGKQIIAQDALAQSRLPATLIGINPVTNSPAWYGLGWNVEYQDDGTVVYSHAGAFTQGSRTDIRISPSEKLGIVVLSNSFPSGIPEGIAATFFDVAQHGQAQKDWLTAWNTYFANAYGPASYASLVATYAKPPAVPSAALPNSAYLGTYTNAFIGDVTVIEKDGGLVLQAGPAKHIFPLKHFDHDLFVYYPYGEMPDYPSSVIFTIGADQKASQLVIDDLNSNGQGVLTRVAK